MLRFFLSFLGVFSFLISAHADQHDDLLTCSKAIDAVGVTGASDKDAPIVGAATVIKDENGNEAATVQEIRSGAGAPGFNVISGGKSFYMPATKGSSFYSLVLGKDKVASFVFSSDQKKFTFTSTKLEPATGNGRVFVLPDAKNTAGGSKAMIEKQRKGVQSMCVGQITGEYIDLQYKAARDVQVSTCDRWGKELEDVILEGDEQRMTEFGNRFDKDCGKKYIPGGAGLDPKVEKELKKQAVKSVKEKYETSIGTNCDKVAFNTALATPLAGAVTSGPEVTDSGGNGVHVFYGKGPKSDSPGGFWNVTSAGAYFVPNNAQKNLVYLEGKYNLSLSCTFYGRNSKDDCAKKTYAAPSMSIGDDSANGTNATKCRSDSQEASRGESDSNKKVELFNDFKAVCDSQPSLDNFKNSAPFPDRFKASLRREFDRMLLGAESKKSFLNRLLTSEVNKERIYKCVSAGVVSQDVLSASIIEGFDEEDSSSVVGNANKPKAEKFQ